MYPRHLIHRIFIRFYQGNNVLLLPIAETVVKTAIFFAANLKPFGRTAAKQTLSLANGYGWVPQLQLRIFENDFIYVFRPSDPD